MSNKLMPEILKVLYDGNVSGYASENPVVEKCEDGTRRIAYIDGNNAYVDTWWGGNPFSGQEYVSIGGKVVWAMQYRGSMLPGKEIHQETAFKFLRVALRNCVEGDVRGPDNYSEGNMDFVSSWGETAANFEGNEYISVSGEKVYVCKFFGGLVDQ